MKGKSVKRYALILSLVFLVNILAGIHRAHAVATIYIDPSSIIDPTMVNGDQFTININITGGHDVGTWQAYVEYDPAVVSLMGLSYGDFLNGSAREGPWGTLTADALAGQNQVNVTDGPSFARGGRVWIKDDFNSEFATISPLPDGIVGDTLYLQSNLVNTYTVAANAVCYPWPEVQNTWAYDTVGGAWVSIGQFTIQYEGQAVPGQEGDGWLGSLTFQVGPYVPPGPTYNRTELTLNATFTYYIEGLTMVKKDIYSGDLLLENGYFRNMGLGDANGDHIVDIFDIGTLSAHWYPGPPIGPLGYDPDADMQTDPSQRGTVDIFDIGIVSANWNNYYP